MDNQALAQLLGSYGEFLGAIGVIVTLGYLAVQIRQNNRATQMSNSHELNEATRAWWAKLFKLWFEQRGHWLAPEFRGIVESTMSKDTHPTASWYREHSGS